MKLRWNIAQLFELFWWRFYIRNKNEANYLYKKKLYWERILKECATIFEVKNNDTLIDMGCGPSGLYLPFPDNNLTAVDPLLDDYEQNLSIFSQKKYPNVTFIKAAIEDFETKEQFDYVFCMNAINHVSNIKTGFLVLSKLAKTNGKIIVSIDAHNYTFLKKLFRFLQCDILHPHQYDKDEYISLLEMEGIKVLSTICLKKNFIFNYYMLIAEKI